MNPPPQLWTPSARQAVLGLTLTLSVGLAVALCRDPTTVPDPAPDGVRATELATRLDPNTADAAALAALPGLGETHAHAIVAYRTAYAAAHPGRPPFATARDLLPIKGIGPATVANLEPNLTFPTPRP